MGCMDFEVMIEDIDPAQLDMELLSRGLAYLATVCNRDGANVVLTGDLEASIKKRLSSAEQAERFGINRVSGQVAAKVILDGARPEVIVNGQLLMPGIAEAIELDVERLFEHEGLHVALYQRGEDVHAIVAEGNLSFHEAHFDGHAAILIDDYRIERALHDSGGGIAATYLEATKDVLDNFAAAVYDGICQRYPNEPIKRCYETTFGAFYSLTTHLAYLISQAVPAADLAHLPTWERFVGEHYSLLEQALHQLPSAAEPVPIDRLLAAVSTIGDQLVEWLEHIGFRTTSSADGGFQFDVLRHDF